MFKDDSPFFSGVRAVVQKMHSISSKKLTPYGLNRLEMRILLKVYEKNGIRQRDIVFESGSKAVGIGIAVKALIKKGYIVRQPDISDRRMQRVFVTEYGLEVKNELIELKSSVEKFVVMGIDPEELLLMERITSKMENWITANDFEHYIENQQTKGSAYVESRN